MRLSVFGLGKLGAPLAACFAVKGFQVIGVDVDSKRVEAIQKGQSPVYEPGKTYLIPVVSTLQLLKMELLQFSILMLPLLLSPHLQIQAVVFL